MVFRYQHIHLMNYDSNMVYHQFQRDYSNIRYHHNLLVGYNLHHSNLRLLLYIHNHLDQHNMDLRDCRYNDSLVEHFHM